MYCLQQAERALVDHNQTAALKLHASCFLLHHSMLMVGMTHHRYAIGNNTSLARSFCW